MRAPFFPLNLLLLLLGLGFLLALVQIGLVSVAFGKLGLSQGSGFLLLFSSLAGSLINLPLFQLKSGPPRPGAMPPLGRLWRFPQLEYRGRTLIAVNVGGALIPASFSLYLLGHNPIAPLEALAGVAGVSAVSYLFSRPVPGVGIGMPVFVAPLSAALFAILIAPELSAPLAYVSGTLGVLVGADLLRLKDIRRLGTAVASIGGAGTFDGIFITGIVAVLLA